MDGNKEIRFLLICNRCAAFKWNERIICPRHHDFRAEFHFNQFLQALRDVENEVLLRVSARTDTAGVMAAVSGVDNNPGEFQAKASDQGKRARVRGFCRGEDLRTGRLCPWERPLRSSG